MGMQAQGAYDNDHQLRRIAGVKVDDFRRLGQKEATKHRPPTEATYPDSHEVELKTDTDRFAANEQTLFEAQIADAGRAALDARQRLRELEANTEQVLADDSLATEVQAELAADRQPLVQAVEARIAAEVEWRGFRSLNSISAVAHYPESMIWHWALIVGLSTSGTPWL